MEQRAESEALVNEPLLRAVHDAEFLMQDLREVIANASPVESLLLLPMIERAASLKNDLDKLVAAVAEQRSTS